MKPASAGVGRWCAFVAGDVKSGTWRPGATDSAGARVQAEDLPLGPFLGFCLDLLEGLAVVVTVGGSMALVSGLPGGGQWQ
jgi:hypothetical protein